MFKLLLILFVIKLYARNDILKLVRKKHGQNILKVVRKYEKLQSQLLKVRADIKFIKTCKSERLIPTFANVKLAIKNAKHKLKSKIARLIMETELQSKHNQKRKIENEFRSVSITLKSSLSVIFYNCLIYQINIASKRKLKAITKRHLRKLDKFRRRTSTPISEKVTFSHIRNTIHNFSNYQMKNTRPCRLGWITISLISLLITPQKLSSRCFTKTFCQIFHTFWTTN